MGLEFGLSELIMAGPLWALLHVGDGLLRAGVGRALLRHRFRGDEVGFSLSPLLKQYKL
jgi:hypothetical protein